MQCSRSLLHKGHPCCKASLCLHCVVKLLPNILQKRCTYDLIALSLRKLTKCMISQHSWRKAAGADDYFDRKDKGNQDGTVSLNLSRPDLPLGRFYRRQMVNLMSPEQQFESIRSDVKSQAHMRYRSGSDIEQKDRLVLRRSFCDLYIPESVKSSPIFGQQKREQFLQLKTAA